MLGAIPVRLEQTLILGGLMLLLLLTLRMLVWLLAPADAAAEVLPPAATPVVASARHQFPPTWTPTATPTASPIATTVPTFQPWATWTATPTWTPSPTLLPALQEKRERETLYRPLFKQVAPEYDLDWRLMMALGWRESRLRPKAVGADREMGLMQVLPSTWHALAPDLQVRDVFDPRSNITVAAAYLNYVRGECAAIGEHDPGCMLLAYNWGPYNMRMLYGQRLTWEQAPSVQRRYVHDILLDAGYR